MTKNNRFVFSLLLIFIVLFIAGCKDKMGGTYSMTIKVTQGGTAVEGAIVTLSEISNSKTAAGVTNASGIATMKSTEGWEGVFPGQYGVAIKKTEVTTSATPPPGTEVDRSSGGEDNAYTVSRELLPAKYGSARTSGLKVTQKNEKGQFELDLSAN
ncbi:MAG: hypothetical protein FWC50_09155 [Planctomycetaceae bacterium]|nr:hypothetical protein [Planctomycetaceae bacterium]